MTTEKKPVSRSERIRLQLLFALFGLEIMSLAPRSPDLKHNLGVSNGLYGVLLSLGAIGSITSLLVMGRLVHKLGVNRALYISGAAMAALMISVPHIHTPIIFAATNVGMALTMSAYNMALHTQTLQRQDESGEMMLPRMHGTWSIGSLVTVIAAIILTSRVSFAWHIDILVSVIWILSVILTRASAKEFVKKSEEKVSMEPINFARIRRIFTFDKSIIVAFALGTFIEFASGDWATLVTNQEIGAKKSASVIVYFVFVVAMILGRMYFVKVIGYRSEQFWIRLASLVGGGGFIIFSQLAWFLAGKGSSLALATEALAFAFAGIGTSFMSPLFITIANRRSPLKPSEVVSQLNLTNTIIAFLGKMFVAWVAQMTSITIALLIPGIGLILVSRLAYLGNPRPVARKG